ncbi:hypothetical protein BCP8-2_080 [Bacillus phage BCP8-2]|uniref:Uncharacterized protein n=1 Tax=Bacillus phage BCP8-2 TaxID=1129192 RepID=A0A0E3D9R7_9CAUD|nr:hypothetical protein BCP8-2_080 [Bacillus phage BCP8-2]AHJ87118.1 hypothetical protein BCP8-2_080 [Bacillus phage BCP8-2]
MTQLEHFMYIRILYQEAVESSGRTIPTSLTKIHEEINDYCDKFNADYGRTVILL